jgi:serine/threonine protein kinase
VKPSNCLFIGGELKLADFGLLTEADRGVSRVGTLSYMPPDGVMDMRADVYAAGLVIYEMITGSPVSRFPALQSRAKAILADGRLSALNRLAVKACDPDRNARFADASEMLEELERLLGSEGAAAAARSNKTPVDPLRRFRRRMLIALSSGLGLLGVAWFAWWSFAGPSRVDVNFITDRFDATIWMDAQPLRDVEGTPYTTPCTVPGLTAGMHDVVFKHPGLADLEVGRIDFSKTREIVAHWAKGVEQGRPEPQGGR